MAWLMGRRDRAIAEPAASAGGRSVGGQWQQARRLFAQLGRGRAAVMLLLLAIGLIVARYTWQMPLLVDAERALYDMRATVSAPHVPQDARITMVTYTDETLFATGIRSPVDRAILTRALAQLDRMGARAIGIDILFDSPTANDAALQAQLRAMRTPTFIGYASPRTNPNNIQYEQERFLSGFLAAVTTDRTRPASIRLTNDSDDVVRRWPGRPAGSPPLMSVALAGEAHAARLDRHRGAIRFRMPAEVAGEGGGVEIREVFAKLPIDTLADPAVAPMLAAEIRDRYVLIGGDIIDSDEFATPLSRIPDPASGEVKPMIGLEVHATMLAQALDGVMPPAPLPVTLWAIAMLAVLGGALTALLDVRAWVSSLLFTGQMAAIAIAPFVLQQRGYDTITMPVFGWAAGWLLGFLALTAAMRAVGAEERAFAQSALGKYLPRDIAQLILREPERLALHGEKRAIYCLFSDLEGFTEMSHGITPEHVARVLNAYLDTLSQVVLEHGGTIDKFVGDAVVAFWGAPIARPDDRERAIAAMIAMVEAGHAFRRRIAEDMGDEVPPIGKTRVGLHHGEAVVGNFGGEGRIQYTALGDSMNTASRLESANKALDSCALASAEALGEEGHAAFVPMGRIRLRGRARPVTVFEPRPDLDERQRQAIRDLVAAHDAGDQPGYAAARATILRWSSGDAAVRHLIARLDDIEAGGVYALS